MVRHCPFYGRKSKDLMVICSRDLNLGEDRGSKSDRLCLCLAYMGMWGNGTFAEGIDYGERAQIIAELFPSDQYLYYKSLAGLCYIYYFKGKRIGYLRAQNVF